MDEPETPPVPSRRDRLRAILTAARGRIGRRLKLWLIVGGSVVVLGGGFLWALPEIVRRTVESQFPKLTGRAVSIEDIDLNLFTGRLVLRKLRIAERDPAETFLQAERIGLRLSPFSLIVGHLRLGELTFTAPKLRIVRTGPVEFNFSDLLALLPAAEPNQPKSRFTMSIVRLALVDGAVMISDRAVSPSRDWNIQGITVEAGGLTTRAAQQPGHLEVRGRVNDATLDASAGSVVLTPVGLILRLSLDRFDLTQVRPYLPPGLPISLESGTLGVALDLTLERGDEGLKRATVSGDIRVEGLALAQPDHRVPFFKLPRLAVAIASADLLARSVTLGSVEVDAPDLLAARDAAGNIDLLALAGASPEAAARSEPAPGPGPAPSAASASGTLPFKAKLERLTVRSGAAALRDEAVSPAREWRLSGLTVDGAGFSTSPEDAPGTLKVSAKLDPMSGRPPATVSLDAGSLRLVPLAATARVALESFDLGALGPYWPPALPAIVRDGSLGVTMDAAVERSDVELTRAVASGDVRLNGLTLVRRGSSSPPFLTVPKLTVGLKQADVMARTVALGRIAIEGVDARAVRDAAGQIDVLELLAGAPAATGAPAPAAAPTTKAKPLKSSPSGTLPFKAKLEGLTVRSGTVALRDEAVSPAREWRLSGLTVDGAGFSTSPEDAPGTLKVSAKLEPMSGRPPATVSLDAGSLRLVPLAATARVALESFDLGALGPYWPPALPAIVRDGSLDVTVDASVQRSDVELTRAVTSGDVRLAGLTLVRRTASSTPFLTVPKLTVGLKQADVMARTVALGRIAIEGVDARAVRDAAGQIDVLELLAAAPAAARAPAASSPAPASPTKPPKVAAPGPPAWRISLDRFDFTKGTATFEDRAVSPITSLAVTDLTVSAERVTWPSTSPARFAVSMTMPGGGRTDVKGTGKLEPLDVQFTMGTRDAPIAPYQAYFPFPARFVGFLSADAQNEIQRAKNGTLILASRGQASARDFEVREPGVDAPVVKLPRLQIEGLDFSWPNYALVNRVLLTKPEVQAERDSNGVINLQRLFAPTGAQAAKSPPGSPAPDAAAKPAAGAASGAPPASGGLLQELVIDFSEIVLVDGYVRFLDRTTTPAFSEALSALAVTIRGASNQVGRHPTSATVSAKIGDGGLEMQGQFSGAGEALRADLAGNVKDFALADANPYVDQLTAWIIDRGKFSLKFHYQLAGDRLDADHEMLLAGLRVQRSKTPHEAPQRLGVPLGLAVALLKDRHGNIDFSIPLHGTLSDRTFDWSEAMWAAARQVIVKLVVSPFNAIGRAVTGGGDEIEKLEVAPVAFAAASPVITPPMEAHLTKVADFLRRAPSITLTLTPAVSAADLETLKEQELNGRVAQLARERGLRDLSEAFTAYAKARLSKEELPERVEEQFALLKSREPVPTGALENLLKSRTDATRDRLIKAEGIPAERLTVSIPAASAAASAASGDGRVEFGIGTAEQ